MCDHQRQTHRDGMLLPCAVPGCDAGVPEATTSDDLGTYTRETFMPAPAGSPAFWFWLRRSEP